MSTTPNFVKDRLLVHYHTAKATGTGIASNTPAATVWKDVSGNGLDGTLKQFAYTDTSGWSENGLVFDGIDDHIEIVSNGKGVFDNQKFTIEVWASLDFPARGTLFDYNHSIVAPYYCAHFRATVNDIHNASHFGHNLGGNYKSAVANFPADLDVNNPIQFVCTFDNGAHRVYNNSILGASSNLEDVIHYVQNPVYIGKCLSSTNAAFKGTIHLVRYYTKALTAAEVAQNYAAGIAWPNDTREVLTASAKIIERKNRIWVV